jgi:hypothetical protein
VAIGERAYGTKIVTGQKPDIRLDLKVRLKPQDIAHLPTPRAIVDLMIAEYTMLIE